MLEIEKIRQLVEMMVTNDLVEISLRDGEEEVNLRRPNPRAEPAGPIVNTTAHTAAQSASSEAEAAADGEDEVELVHISAPMVGTFYAAHDPESTPFVQVGSEVEPGTVVCILEAMKVFNEIKAEVAGVVARVLVKNADPVEYGQSLFAVRPS